MRKIVISLFALMLALGPIACKKPAQVPDEDAATYKKRLGLIYTGKSAVGTKAAGDVIEILNKAGQFSNERAVDLYALDNKVVEIQEEIANNIFNGFSNKDAIEKVKQAITIAQNLEDRGVIGLSEQNRNLFLIVTGGIKSSLTTYQSILQSQAAPSVAGDAVKARAALARARSARSPEWIFQITDVIILAYGEAESLNNIPTVDVAHAEILKITGATKAKNQARIDAITKV